MAHLWDFKIDTAKHRIIKLNKKIAPHYATNITKGYFLPLTRNMVYIQKDFITSHDLLFEVSPTILFNKLKHYITLAGLKTIRIHNFRHSYVNHMIKNIIFKKQKS